MAKNGNGNDRDPDLPGPPPEALKRHVFEGLSPEDKLDRLLSLYSGLASKLESTRKDFANREADIHTKIDNLTTKMDYVRDLERALLSHFDIRVPTEPPPPAPPPKRRRSDD
jgi:hypothetical protein